VTIGIMNLVCAVRVGRGSGRGPVGGGWIARLKRESLGREHDPAAACALVAVEVAYDNSFQLAGRGVREIYSWAICARTDRD